MAERKPRQMLAESLKVLIVESRRHEAVADELLVGAKAALAEAKAEYDLIFVPGPLEIPTVVAMADQDAHRPAGVRYDGYVALGCVLHDPSVGSDITATHCVRSLMDLAAGRRMAIGIGVLTVQDEAQALGLAKLAGGDAGGAAARACLALIAARRKLVGQAP